MTSFRGPVASKVEYALMLKLNLRDLFWLVLMMGILSAWWVDRLSVSREKEALSRRWAGFYRDNDRLSVNASALYSAFERAHEELNEKRAEVGLEPVRVVIDRRKLSRADSSLSSDRMPDATKKGEAP